MRSRDGIVAHLPDHLAELVDWWLAGVRFVDPRRLVREHLQHSDRPTVVLAIGKAASAMAAGADDIVGDRVTEGLIVTDAPGAVPLWATELIGGHPLPTDASLHAGRTALQMMSSVDPEHRVIALVSGGGSSLIDLPHPDLDLDDVREIVDQLLLRGAPIGDINGIRTAMSIVKGGGLATACPAPIETLVLSDVPGADAGLVASGPTVGTPPSPDLVARCLARYGIGGPEAERVIALSRVRESTTRARPATIVGDGFTAARAAADAARETGAMVDVDADPLDGPADQAAMEAVAATPAGSVRVFAGETTVSVTGGGVGGRNQHAALAAALDLTGRTRFLACGTDGVDGPTDAAGAVVDATTITDRAAAEQALADHDSHRSLAAAAALVRTGRTGTNVADVWIVDRRSN